MILELHGDRSLKRINVTKDFFEDTKVRVGKKTVTVTPSQKADQLGNDYYGRSYRGHVLTCDNKLVSKSLGNRNLRTSFSPRSDKTSKGGASNPHAPSSYVFSR